jgi:hypothetical protein
MPWHTLERLDDARLELRFAGGASRGDIALDLGDQGCSRGVEVLRAAVCGDAGSSK